MKKTHQTIHASKDFQNSGDDLETQLFLVFRATASSDPGLDALLHLLPHLAHELLHAFAPHPVASALSFSCTAANAHWTGLVRGCQAKGPGAELGENIVASGESRLASIVIQALQSVLENGRGVS